MTTRKRSVTELVAIFAENVQLEMEALYFKANAKAANKYARRTEEAFEQLRTHGDEGRDALSALLGDERLDVRVAAAAYLLRYKTVAATAVLREAAAGKSFVALMAQETLNRWKDGTWSLDPAE